MIVVASRPKVGRRRTWQCFCETKLCINMFDRLGPAAHSTNLCGLGARLAQCFACRPSRANQHLHSLRTACLDQHARSRCLGPASESRELAYLPCLGVHSIHAPFFVRLPQAPWQPPSSGPEPNRPRALQVPAVQSAYTARGDWAQFAWQTPARRLSLELVPSSAFCRLRCPLRQPANTNDV